MTTDLGEQGEIVEESIEEMVEMARDQGMTCADVSFRNAEGKMYTCGWGEGYGIEIKEDFH